MGNPKLKLTYFNIMGLAEPIRYILAYAGADYEDNRIARADWPALKETMPFHQMPILEVDGKILNQSTAIARYVGKRYNLVAEDPLTEALLEAFVDNLKDVKEKLKSMIVLKTPEAKKECEDAMQFFLSRVEPLAKGGYLYGNKATWVDCFFAGFSDSVSVYVGSILDNYPNLTAVVENIRSKDTVKKYLENRPAPES